MTEDKAIELAVKLMGKRIIPSDNWEDAETRVIQTIAVLYLNGYEVVPRFKPRITAGEIEQMKADSVIY